MIAKTDLLSIPFYKKSAFTGSYEGMRYRIRCVKDEENSSFEAVIWPGPYIFDATADEHKEFHTFPFTDEGLALIAEWLNQKWTEAPEKWQIYTKNYDSATPFHPTPEANNGEEK